MEAEICQKIPNMMSKSCRMFWELFPENEDNTDLSVDYEHLSNNLKNSQSCLFDNMFNFFINYLEYFYHIAFLST